MIFYLNIFIHKVLEAQISPDFGIPYFLVYFPYKQIYSFLSGKEDNDVEALLQNYVSTIKNSLKLSSNCISYKNLKTIVDKIYEKFFSILDFFLFYTEFFKTRLTAIHCPRKSRIHKHYNKEDQKEIFYVDGWSENKVYYTQLNIESKSKEEFKALSKIDTGASRSLCSTYVVEKLKKEPDLKRSTVAVIGLSKQEVTVFPVKIMINYSNLKFSLDFYITEEKDLDIKGGVIIHSMEQLYIDFFKETFSQSIITSQKIKDIVLKLIKDWKFFLENHQIPVQIIFFLPEVFIETKCTKVL